MKAVLMKDIGGPEVLSYEDIPEPEIKSETEILVKLKATGLNPVDVKQRGRGTWYPNELPAILGLDASGIVEDTGKAVEKFTPGDEVYFAYGGVGKEPGNYAEYAVVEERFVAPKPKSISFVEAAAAPSGLITSWDCLFFHGGLRQNQHVIVHAGAGGVGHMAVQLARLKGAHVCTTVANDEQVDFVSKLGADRIVHYQKSDFVKEALEWTREQGVDLVVDLVGKETLFKSFQAIRCYGTLVALLKPEPEYANWSEARLKNIRVCYELMFTPMYYNLLDHQKRQTNVLYDCLPWFEEKKLSIHVSKTFPLKDASEAHRAIERGDTMGKVVLVIDE